MWSEKLNVGAQEILFARYRDTEINVLTYETVHRLGLEENIIISFIIIRYKNQKNI